MLVRTLLPEGMPGMAKSFYRLFNYLSGNNGNLDKIEITAAVFLNRSGPETRAMSFVLPAAYSIATALDSKDCSVKVLELNNYMAAVLRFSGFLNQHNILTNWAVLRSVIEERG